MTSSPLTAVVLTRDEEKNLGACLESVAGLASRIVVVDSGSSDRTVEIARSFGADVVTHPFETHARQWKWALDNLPLGAEWILGLDADQRLTRELRDEIGGALSRADAQGIAGFFLPRRQIFRGKWIRHGGYYPKYLLKLFRRASVSIDASELVDHHFHVEGRTAELRHDLVERNLNEDDISVWLRKHVRYAELAAQEEWAQRRNRNRSRNGAEGSGRLFGDPQERSRRLKSFWRLLPRYVRPGLYFGYRYFLRLGFLDGKEGFLFHFLQGFWYRLLVDIKLEELEREARP